MASFLEIPQTDMWLYILQGVTIAVTLLLGISNFVLSRRIQKSRNIVDITTKYRLERMKAQQDAMRRLLVNASPMNLRLNAASAPQMAGQAIDAAAAFETLLHGHFDHDRVLIDATRRSAMLATEFVRSFGSGGCESELEQELEAQLEQTSRLSDMYAAAEWSRIKNETEGRNTKTEEWYVAYDDVYRQRAEMDRKSQSVKRLCEE